MRGKDDAGIERRDLLKCMAWAGSGLLWTMSGGVPTPRSLGAANAAESGFAFIQISDSHIGFNKAANPDPKGSLAEAVAKIGKLPGKPAFIVHTGDITHLSKPQEFDDAEQLLSAAKLDVHYTPGEHDVVDESRGDYYVQRFAKNSGGKGWYGFDHGGVHFVCLVNVRDLQAGGLGRLGDEQLAWLAEDLKSRGASTPIVVFAHMPLWTIAESWGWGTQDSAHALKLLTRFGSVTVLNGHIHQIMQKVEGAVTFHTARSTAFPQPAPGAAAAPGPMVVPAEQLRSMLGVSSVALARGKKPTIIDAALA
jgi:hypothetical protein